MISCEAFRNRFEPSTEDASVLEHLRRCDVCLEFAIQADPEVMFRALGGETELAPPGGVDMFVDDVMREVRLRSTENGMEPRRRSSWTRGLAVAATLAATFTGATFFYQRQVMPVAGVPIVRAILTAPTTTKPVVETYDSQNATIVEVPTEGEADVRVVMIFDESLPADL